jgi:hypothetical protein
LTISSYQDFLIAGSNVQHLPAGTLRQLDCSFDWSNTAQIDTMCAHTGLRSLSLTGGYEFRYFSPGAQADDVLAPLSALQQLTALELGSVRRVQLQHLQLPQLQQLVVRVCRSAEDELQPIRLDQLTALQMLRLQAAGNGLQRQDCLPPNLCQLSWAGWVTSRTAGMQPLLALSCLQKLHITCCDVLAASAEDAKLVAQELLQLSTLHSLQEISLLVDKEAGLTADDVAASAWQLLPLKELHLQSQGAVQADLLQQLSTLQSLTSLILCNTFISHQQLGLSLQQLTALQDLDIFGLSLEPGGVSSNDGSEAHTSVEGIATLLQAICDLPDLERLRVRLPVWLGDAAVQQLSSRFAALLPAVVGHFQVKADVVTMESNAV